MPNFNIRLKEIRASKKIYQKTLAEKLKITIRAYQLYESGDGYPSFQGLITLADYLGVSIDYLVGRTDNPLINK